MAIFLFVLFAITLTSTVVLTVTQLVTSIQSLYNVANPPHFLQMHKGEINQDEIDKFNRNYKGVTQWQTITMIDLYGDDFIIEHQGETFSLKECRLDLGLVKQTEKNDLLLDEKHRRVELKPNEIGIPIILKEQYPFEVGDLVHINRDGVNKTFQIACFVYDSQMNSTMCSSTRILLSDEDFNELNGKIGENEYLIETYFEKSSMATEYQSAYEQQGTLPMNGQAVTYSIIFLLSALTDLMMAFVMLFISIFLIIIAFYCMKNTLMTAMEEDIKEIGTMKTIGIDHKTIRNLFLNKMKVILGISYIFGVISTFAISNRVTSHMSKTFGKQSLSFMTVLLTLVVAAIVVEVALLYCRHILKKIRRIDAVKVMTNQIDEKRKAPKLIVVVTALITIIIVLPVNMVSTLKNEKFVTYMGWSSHDILIEVEQGQQLHERLQAMEERLNQKGISYEVNKMVRVPAIDSEGKEKMIHVNCAKTAGDGLSYLSGYSPSNESEIAISALESQALGLKQGDTLMLCNQNEKVPFMISGIYQDVTSGGMTAKVKCEITFGEEENYSIISDVASDVEGKELISELQNDFKSGYQIEWMKEFMSQTLGVIVDQIEQTTIGVVLIGIFLLVVIILMYLKLQIVKDSKDIAVKKAIGVSLKKIRIAEIKNAFCQATIGILLGSIFIGFTGEMFVSAAFAVLQLGISKIHLNVIVWLSYGLIPIALLILVSLISWVYSKKVKTIQVVEYLNQ